MRSPENSLAKWAASAGFGVYGTSVFGGRLMPSPDPQVAVAAYDAPPSETYGTTTSNPSIQFRIRGPREGVIEAEDVARRLWRAIADAGPFTVASFTTGAGADLVTVDELRVQTLRLLSDVIPIGFDELERREFTINAQLFEETA